MNFFANKKSSVVRLAYLILLVLTISACHKEDPYTNLPVYGPTQIFYALTNQNTLSTYNAKDVRTAAANVNITGLATSEIMLSIDFRPATGELYGISTLSKLYLIDVASGRAKAVISTPFSPAISGTTVSMDFNPVNDRIRVVTNTGQNFRLNPETGIVEGTDTNLTNTSVSGIAHNNNYAGAAASILYDLDPAANKLYKQDPENAGALVGIGNFELSLGSNVCFDISPDNTNILAVGKLEEGTRLFTIALANGKATLAGKFAQGTTIRGIAIPTSPVAYAIDNANNLLIFNPTQVISTSVNPTIYTKVLTGLQTGETIYGMDMRPLNGQIYVVGSSNRLYILNIGTGALTQVGTGALSTALSGTSFGVDFNPLTDVIRVVSNTGQNLRINPVMAEVIVDSTISPTTAKISAAAFSNNFRNASATILYVIDAATDKLYKQDPNTGVIAGDVDLKLAIETTNGFDIVYNTGDIAYGIFTVGSKNTLYTINLSSGETSAQFDLTKPVTAFTMGLRFN